MNDRNPDQPDAGLACFKDQSRICGPDCMAYLPQKPEGKAYIGEQWAHCHILVNQDRIGRHLVVLAGLADRGVSDMAAARASATRSKPAPSGG